MRYLQTAAVRTMRVTDVNIIAPGKMQVITTYNVVAHADGRKI